MTRPFLSRPGIGAMFVIFSAIFFALKGILAKFAYREGVDPDTLLTLRMISALPVYVAGLWWFGRKNPSSRPSPNSRDFLWIVLLGLLGFDISSVLDFRGLSLISASLERLVLFLYPTFVVFLSWVLNKRRVGMMEVLASLLAYGGIALVTGGLSRLGGSEIRGVLLVLGSGFFYAVYLVGVERITKRVNPLWMTCAVMVTATIAIFLQSSLSGSLHFERVDRTVLGLGILMGILATAIPTFLISQGISMIGANRAAVLSFTGPVVTLVLATIFLGERMSPAGWTGSGLVLLGVMLVAHPVRPGFLRRNG